MTEPQESAFLEGSQVVVEQLIRWIGAREFMRWMSTEIIASEGEKEGEAIRLQDATSVGLLRQAHVVIPNSAMQERDDTSM